MTRWRRMLMGLPGAVLIACSDGATAVERGLEHTLGVEQAQLGASLLRDASSRSATALLDPTVATRLQAQLGAAASRMAAEDGVGAFGAMSAARATLERYVEQAGPEDAADREVIGLALDGAERLLRETAASR